MIDPLIRPLFTAVPNQPVLTRSMNLLCKICGWPRNGHAARDAACMPRYMWKKLDKV